MKYYQNMTLLAKYLVITLSLTISISSQAQELDPDIPVSALYVDVTTIPPQESAIQPGFDLEILEPTIPNRYPSSTATGDGYNPVTGEVTFDITDISIPGNSAIPVTLRRWIPSADFDTGGPTGWQWNIPMIKGNFLDVKEGHSDAYWDWDWGGSNWHTGANCTSSASQILYNVNLVFYPSYYWEGKLLHIPDATTEVFLNNSSEPKQITKSNYKVIACIDNSDGEQGIVVAAPNGFIYTFNQIKSYDNGKEVFNAPVVKTKLLMVSSIQDKFGNTVTYSYTEGELTKISSSDGREINIAYENTSTGKRPITATANGRVWTYDYASRGDQELISVTLPNNTQWVYNGVHQLEFSPDPNEQAGVYNQIIQRKAYGSGAVFKGPECNVSATKGTQYASVKTPEGATINYTFNSIFHNRSNVDPAIVWYTTLVEGFARSSSCKVNFSLTKREISGPNISSFEWTYDYSQNEGRYTTASNLNKFYSGISDISVPALGGFPTFIDVNSAVNFRTTTVTGPDTKTVYYIDREFRSPTESMVLGEDTIDVSNSSSPVLLQRVEKTLVQDNVDIGNHWYFCPCGDGPAPYLIVNEAQLTRRTNLSQKDIKLFDDSGSNTYTTQYSNYDSYGFVKDIMETNDANNLSRYIQNDYLHDVTSWTLGLPKKMKVGNAVTSLTTVSETTYKTHVATLEGVSYTSEVPEFKKNYGLWHTKYVSYFDDGNVSKIEFNQGLKNSDNSDSETNRYIGLSDYYRGQPQTITKPGRYPNSQVLTATKMVDDNGWVINTTDFNKNLVGYGYDLIGRLKYIDYPDDWLDTVYSWTQLNDEAPKRIQSRCALNSAKNGCVSGSSIFTSAIQFDGLMNSILITNTDLTNGNIQYQNSTFNSLGLPIFTSYWSATATESNGISNVYDGLQRHRSSIQSGGGRVITEYLSDNKIKVNQYTSANASNETITKYLAFGSPSYDQATYIDSPEGVTTTIEVNVLGDVLSIKQQGMRKFGDAAPISVSSTEFRAYDNSHRLCKVRRDDVGTSVFKYNNLGEITSKSQGVSTTTNTDCTYTADASKAVDFNHDNLGDLWTVDYPDSAPDVTYTRDGNGNIKTLTAGTVSHSYHYNSLNLLDDETLTVGTKRLASNAAAKSIDYEYDSSGSLSSLTYPDGDVVSYVANGFGQLTQAIRNARVAGESLGDRTYASDATYYPSGNINTFTYGNGLVHKTTLNTRKVPQNIKDSIGSNVALNYSYTYDDNLNVTSITDLVNEDYNLSSMTYDGLGRFTSASGGEAIGLSHIEYDGIGNITHYRSLDRDFEFDYDVNNRLDEVYIAGTTPIPIRHMAYDDRGNVTDNSLLSFTYNRANQMDSVNGGNKTFLYDGHNRRVKKTSVTASGIETNYSLYSQNGTLLYRETDEGGINYIYLGNKLIAKDGFIPENSGNQHYRPFGESIEGAKEDVGYTGHKFDKDLGLSYMQARYYDPVIGRFYSNDPVGYTSQNPVMSFNRYVYVNNNPYKYTDPNGEFLKLAKAAFNVVRKASKNGWNFKKAGKDELASLADNLSTLADGQLTLDDAFAVADLATGFGGEAKQVYHRLGDSAENISSIQKTGKLEGNAPTNFVQSDIPKVQAYDGPLPEGKQGFEFTTTAKPDSGGIPGQPTWSGNGHNPNVQTVGDKAVIQCTVTKTSC